MGLTQTCRYAPSEEANLNTGGDPPNMGTGATSNMENILSEEDPDSDGHPALKFNEQRKIRFARYISKLSPAKITSFLRRFEVLAKWRPNVQQMCLYFHSLICLYLRKAENVTQLPQDIHTKELCFELSDALFEYYASKATKLKVEHITTWIQKKELLKLYGGADIEDENEEDGDDLEEDSDGVPKMKSVRWEDTPRASKASQFR